MGLTDWAVLDFHACWVSYQVSVDLKVLLESEDDLVEDIMTKHSDELHVTVSFLKLMYLPLVALPMTILFHLPVCEWPVNPGLVTEISAVLASCIIFMVKFRVSCCFVQLNNMEKQLEELLFAVVSKCR